MDAQESAFNLPAITAAGMCLNCEAARHGPYCHECGQHCGAHHRSLRKLTLEFIESLTETDGRVLRTLRLLVLDPGQLTNDFLAGRRARQLKPAALFLAALALFLLVFPETVHVEFVQPTPAQAANIPHWLVPFNNLVLGNQSLYLATLRHSAEFCALLAVPVLAVLLRLIYLNRREKLLYDHVIFVLHELAFQFLPLTVLPLLPDPLSLLAYPAALAMLAHLFLHLRKAYGGRVIATGLRLAALLGLGSIALLALLLLWLFVPFLLVSK